MKDMEDTKKNSESSKQESSSKSKEKSLCKELLSSEKNVENADYQVIHEIEGEDLFKILENMEGYCVVIGEYKISQTFKNLDEAKKFVKKKSWGLIMNMMSLMIHLNNVKNGN